MKLETTHTEEKSNCDVEVLDIATISDIELALVGGGCGEVVFG